ncbi:MAG TPA: type VI secretion protein IcmF/TssM N-terminal domain-containing protein, partial [Polyangia bacterium]|nr:type VI secretion protein IcmF/TssM N-terminal domain-containing protein [Polyangia bacterium]
RQFDSLRQGLIDLVANLFGQSVYQDAPIMRGVYFTSGTQEGRPIDRVMASMAEAFGVRPPVLAASTTKPKSYFVRDLFQQVVFPDAAVAVRSTRGMRRQRAIRWLTATVALAISAAFLALPISSYLKNTKLVDDGRAFVEHLSEQRGDAVLSSRSLERAEPMATRLATLAINGPELSREFGLYPGDDLLVPLRAAVEQLLVAPLLRVEAGRLQDFARGRGDADEAQAQNGLVLELLLTQPKAADEPAPENDHWKDKWVDVSGRQAGELWVLMAGEDATARARHAVENAVRFYAARAVTVSDLLERKTALGQVISRARTALVGSHEGDPLADVLRDPALPRDIHLVDVLGGAVTVFQAPPATGGTRGGPIVPGAFTPAGWKIVRERISRLTADHSHDENAWVLAAPKVREGADATTLRTEYFRRYVDAWKAFLLSLAIREPTSVDDARALMKMLVTAKPLDAVWKNAGRQLIFKDELTGLLAAGKAALNDKLDDAKKGLPAGVDIGGIGGDAAGARRDELTSPEDVGREFSSFLNFGLTKPTGIDSYDQILSEVAATLGDSGTPDAAAFTTALKGARLKLQTLVSTYNDHNWEAALLDKMLSPPLSGAEVAVTGATGDSANRKWCENVVVVFDQLLAGRYPFAGKRGAREVPVADIDKIFQPKGGALWQYFSTALQADFDHPAGTTIFQLKDQTTVKYKASLPAFLKRAQELTDLLYGKDGSRLGITVGMRIRASAPYTKLTFESGGRKLTYFNARERWEEFPWPGRGAVFHTFLGANEGQYGFIDGEWGLFHLLDEAKLTVSSDGEEYLSAVWSPASGAPSIRADVKPAALLHAFRGIEIPRGIVAGSSGCGR